jgi:hypothetical protein
MSDDPPVRAVEKAIALILVTAWTGGTLAMTFAAVETTVPPYWMPFTALIFLLVGRLWNLEVEKLLPSRGGGGGSGGGKS